MDNQSSNVLVPMTPTTPPVGRRFCFAACMVPQSYLRNPSNYESLRSLLSDTDLLLEISTQSVRVQVGSLSRLSSSSALEANHMAVGTGGKACRQWRSCKVSQLQFVHQDAGYYNGDPVSWPPMAVRASLLLASACTVGETSYATSSPGMVPQAASKLCRCRSSATIVRWSTLRPCTSTQVSILRLLPGWVV